MFVMSKSKIGPRNRLTVVWLELNRAEVSKRLQDFIENQLTVMEFGNIYHFVDVSTILGYLHKPDRNLKPFEGIIVSELQASGKFVDGRLHN